MQHAKGVVGREGRRTGEAPGGHGGRSRAGGSHAGRERYGSAAPTLSRVRPRRPRLLSNGLTVRLREMEETPPMETIFVAGGSIYTIKLKSACREPDLSLSGLDPVPLSKFFENRNSLVCLFFCGFYPEAVDFGFLSLQCFCIKRTTLES